MIFNFLRVNSYPLRLLKTLVLLISKCKIILKNFIRQEMLYIMRLRNEFYIIIIIFSS
jgi:hypothetical protein